MPTYKLPDLPHDLRWLISMEPTRENLCDYLRPPGRKNLFNITNVFASPPTAPLFQREYDLVTGGVLANADWMGLLVFNPPDYSSLDRLHRRLRTGELQSDFQPILPPLTDDNLPSRMEERKHQAHIADVERLCYQLLSEWESAFRLYGGSDDPWVSRLYLNPHAALPTPSLVRQLATEGETPLLILLTARHELGYFYQKAKDWQDQVLDADRLGSEDEFFSQGDWLRLSARQRGYHYTGLGRTSSAKTHGRHRKDAPVLMFSTDSSVAQLYFALERWCVLTYEAIIEAPQCEVDNCTRKAKPRSHICRHCAKKRKAEQSQKLYIAMRSGKHRPTPTLERKWAREG